MEHALTLLSMPVIHITLQCAMPTAHADGAFRTLVAVSATELCDVQHLREAVRRAMIVGFGGPHHVVAWRQLDALAPERSDHAALTDGHPVLRSLEERLQPLLTPVAPEEGEGRQPETDGQPTRGQQRPSASLAESGPRKRAR